MTKLLSTHTSTAQTISYLDPLIQKLTKNDLGDDLSMLMTEVCGKSELQLPMRSKHASVRYPQCCSVQCVSRRPTGDLMRHTVALKLDADLNVSPLRAFNQKAHTLS